MPRRARAPSPLTPAALPACLQSAWLRCKQLGLGDLPLVLEVERRRAHGAHGGRRRLGGARRGGRVGEQSKQKQSPSSSSTCHVEAWTCILEMVRAEPRVQRLQR
uniref:Uncharacterized protein n=1 Tax=Oryza glaberrima TaxID=4538 RepID=I1PA59_ORYGL